MLQFTLPLIIEIIKSVRSLDKQCDDMYISMISFISTPDVYVDMLELDYTYMCERKKEKFYDIEYSFNSDFMHYENYVSIERKATYDKIFRTCIYLVGKRMSIKLNQNETDNFRKNYKKQLDELAKEIEKIRPKTGKVSRWFVNKCIP